MAFIHLITELGYREDRGWDEENEEDNRILLKLTKLADEHTGHQMKSIEKWKADFGHSNLKQILKGKIEEAIDSEKYGPNFIAGLVFVKNILLAEIDPEPKVEIKERIEYVDKELEEGKRYKTKFQTGEFFTIKKIIRKAPTNKIIRVEGLYDRDLYLMCPLDPERLIPEQEPITVKYEVCAGCGKPIEDGK